METTTAMIPYHEAKARAEAIRAILAPHCAQIEIAGSVRRCTPFVSDIEIVCQPQPELDMFGEPMLAHSFGFVTAAMSIGTNIRGQPKYGRYVYMLTADGIQVDIFCARAENWGLILAIRTGSAEYSHRVLACEWVRRGYHSENGMLYRNGQAVTIKTEAELFRLLNLKHLPPEQRSL